jgi:nucleoside-diphosphate-sugar epimerase
VNIGGGDPKTINEVLRAVSDAVGTWIEPTRTPRRAGDVRRTHADVGRARELLGWSASVPWTDAVERTVAWFREG